MRHAPIALLLLGACGAYEAPTADYRVEELSLREDSCGLVDRLPGADEDLSELHVEWFGQVGGFHLAMGTGSIPCDVDGRTFACVPRVTEEGSTAPSDFALHETLEVTGKFKRGSDAMKLQYLLTLTCSGPSCADYEISEGIEMPCEVVYEAMALPY